VRRNGCAAARVFAIGQCNAEGERRSGVEARIDGAKRLEAAEHQTGEDDEHECEGHLSAHQQLTCAVAATACGVTATTLVQ
jgi:hypothetical protein